MTDLLLVRRLKCWTANVGKRLIKSPKIYVRDSGITHALLNIPEYNSLLGHPVVGVSTSRVQPYYYGTPRGAEIDLVLEFPGGAKWAIEIKRNSTPSISKGFYSGCEDIKPDKRFVVYSGGERFPMGDDITAISLPDLMEELLKQ